MSCCTDEDTEAQDIKPFAQLAGEWWCQQRASPELRSNPRTPACISERSTCLNALRPKRPVSTSLELSGNAEKSKDAAMLRSGWCLQGLFPAGPSFQ